MKRALIFGVTGQTGSYLAEHLLEQGYEVIGVARRVSSPNDDRIKHLRDNGHFRVVRGDITDASSVARLLHLHAPSEVYNLAAQSFVKDSFDEPIHTTAVDYVGCLNILEAIRAIHEGNRPRFYQASSSEMFGSACSTSGDGSRVDLPCLGEPFQDERTPMLPNSPYAIAKLAAHHAVRLYREAYGIFACSGISFNHEGPRRGPEFVTRKITLYVARWKRARDLGLPIEPLRLGNLHAKRDWSHAKDVVMAQHLMLQADKPDDYVICSGETHSVAEFLAKAFACVGLENESLLPVVIDPDLYRPCEVPYLRGCADKARAGLGWAPKVTFDELVREMVYSDLASLYGDSYALKVFSERTQ